MDLQAVLVIGAGVIGLSVAYELATRGKRVTIIDQSLFGRGASWAGAGILPSAAKQSIVDPLEQLRSLSHKLHAQWAEQLLIQTSIDTGFRRCGGIYLARSAAEAATLAAQENWWREHGIPFVRLTAPDLRTYEPELSHLLDSGSVRSAWYLPDECQLRNPRHLQALAQACRQMGVDFWENYPLATIVIDSNRRATAIGASKIPIVADQVCICSGAWARQHLEQLQFHSGIMPVRGQMILFQLEKKFLRSVINEGPRYLVPRDDGRVLAGSSEEEVGYRIETTEEILSQLQTWASGLVPALQPEKIERTWAGLRPGSYDGLPYIGQVPGTENLFLAAGHFRSGLHLSCATAVVVADLIEGKPPRIDIEPFRIGRG